MKNKIKGFLTVFSIILLITVSGCSSDTETADVAAVNAPDFTLKAINAGDITLSDYRGRIVLLDFWATWCGPCMQSIPELVRLHKKYSDKGLVVLGVSMDKPSEADDNQLEKFMASFDINYHVMRDDGSVSRKYSVAVIPTMHIINREGKIVKTINGFIPGEVPEIIEEII